MKIILYTELHRYELQAKSSCLITCRMRPSSDLKSFRMVSFEMSEQAVWIASFSSSALLIVTFNNLLSMIDHLFSIIFRSVLFAGQESNVIFCFSRYSFVKTDTCGPVLSC
jgi:uncharacterized membrane protein